MAFDSTNDNRFVIPLWRDYNRTLLSGELFTPLVINNRNPPKYNIQFLIEEWKNNKYLFFATNLLSSIIVSDHKDLSLIEELVSYIAQHQNSSLFQKSFANKIKETIDTGFSDFGSLEFSILNETFDEPHIYEKISQIKKLINDYPTNGIQYANISWYYMNLGQIDKAKHNIDIAYKLNPNNRYILRACSKFYLLIKDIELARVILSKSRLSKFDPWIMASEISISDMLDKRSNNIKKGIEILNSHKFEDFDTTELRSSLATIELQHGSLKSSRRLFKDSLFAPNDNSLAQAEWASNNFQLFDINPNEYTVIKPFEALTYDYYQKQNWDEAFNYSKKWYFDIPYSEEAIIWCSHIASTFLNKFSEAEKLLKFGHKINPKNAMIINNLAYCQAKLLKTDEAENTLKKINSLNSNSIKISTKICLAATEGLINLKKNNTQEGINNYNTAIEVAKKVKNKELEILAKLNLAFELSDTDEIKKQIILEMNQESVNEKFKGLVYLKNKLLATT